MKAMHFAPDLVVCSPAVRAVQTSEGVAPGLPMGTPVELDEALYHAVAGDLLRRLRRLPPEIDSVLGLGHNPGLEDLALGLVAAGDPRLRTRLKRRFPTGAVGEPRTKGPPDWRVRGRGRGRAVLTTPKAEEVRTITVPALVAVELPRHLRDHVGEGIVFRGLRGAEMLRRDQFYSSAWRPALRSAGLAQDSFKFHACRHLCASTLLAEGAAITAVAGHLGDTVETVSRVYAHGLRVDRDVRAAVLDRVLAPRDALRAHDEASDAGS